MNLEILFRWHKLASGLVAGSIISPSSSKRSHCRGFGVKIGGRTSLKLAINSLVPFSEIKFAMFKSKGLPSIPKNNNSIKLPNSFGKVLILLSNK